MEGRNCLQFYDYEFVGKTVSAKFLRSYSHFYWDGFGVREMKCYLILDKVACQDRLQRPKLNEFERHQIQYALDNWPTPEVDKRSGRIFYVVKKEGREYGNSR